MQNTSWSSQAPVAWTTVFHRWVGRSIRSHASVYPFRCQWCGTRVGGVRVTSSGDFMAPVTIQ